MISINKLIRLILTDSNVASKPHRMIETSQKRFNF